MPVLLHQRLEESVLSEEKRLTVRGPSPDAPPTCLPARVREIVTKNLSDNGELPQSSVPHTKSVPSLPDFGFSVSSRGHVLGHVPPGGEPSTAGGTGEVGGPAGTQQSRPRRARHQVRCNQ